MKKPEFSFLENSGFSCFMDKTPIINELISTCQFRQQAQ
jgi:hypothetical protein